MLDCNSTQEKHKRFELIQFQHQIDGPQEKKQLFESQRTLIFNSHGSRSLQHEKQKTQGVGEFKLTD